MTISSVTVDELKALALDIFNPNVQPNSPFDQGLGEKFDPAFYTGIKGQDDAIDARLAALIGPVMLAIDGSTLATGFKYTLNFTNATRLRPKHWFIQGLYEFVPGVVPPCSVGFAYLPPPGGTPHYGDMGHYGFTVGTCMCAGICNVWALIVGYWLAGDYPWAVGAAP